jgi:hypothetical protein
METNFKIDGKNYQSFIIGNWRDSLKYLGTLLRSQKTIPSATIRRPLKANRPNVKLKYWTIEKRTGSHNSKRITTMEKIIWTIKKIQMNNDLGLNFK